MQIWPFGVLSYVLRLVLCPTQHTTILSLHFMFPFRELQRNILTILICCHLPPIPPSHQPPITHHAPPPFPFPTTALHPPATTSPRHHTPTTHPNELALVLFPVQSLCNNGKIWKRLNVLCFLKCRR